MENLNWPDPISVGDMSDVVEMLETLAAELDATDEKKDLALKEALEDAAYEIRVRLNDVGALSAYWEDERFAERRERDKNIV